MRTAARTVPGQVVLRVGRDLGNLALVDRSMTLAAHAFTSILPILIVVGALRARMEPGTGPVFAEHLGLNPATADILEQSLPGEAQQLRATGIVGIVLLVIAATSFARALERCLRTIWHTPTVSMKFAWRWLAALAAVVIGLALIVSARIILVGDSVMPVIEFVVEIAVWTSLWLVATWIVVNRRISIRELLPGSVLAGIGFAVAGLVGRVILPPLLADSANRFGVLGMAFTYIGWLLVLAGILLVSATAGRVLYLTWGGSAWRGSSATMTRRDTPHVDP
ncbi:YhjD/YihY/BrkB family envelope integrity protein [Microbacterium sp. CFBP9034]|uniref:YhjD/YihY/BrkB family envelope integrity protein n=1 Tax=Microbacterium sp. CFBP9034 TaxID=3096540 RepID=UPI002A6AD35B|nr:YhjD/YihY/BrkB family envelope integrity protein [Microbacterium sp. CFBP9034]MDY0910780.1 YhjD/YihY/BrkB family envelope integrity protein [Microbacterium sp. CFBP9034]